jgi:hypothetical protein
LLQRPHALSVTGAQATPVTPPAVELSMHSVQSAVRRGAGGADARGERLDERLGVRRAVVVAGDLAAGAGAAGDGAGGDLVAAPQRLREIAGRLREVGLRLHDQVGEGLQVGATVDDGTSYVACGEGERGESEEGSIRSAHGRLLWSPRPEQARGQRVPPRRVRSTAGRSRPAWATVHESGREPPSEPRRLTELSRPHSARCSPYVQTPFAQTPLAQRW